MFNAGSSRLIKHLLSTYYVPGSLPSHSDPRGKNHHPNFSDAEIEPQAVRRWVPQPVTSGVRSGALTPGAGPGCGSTGLVWGHSRCRSCSKHPLASSGPDRIFRPAPGCCPCSQAPLPALQESGLFSFIGGPDQQSLPARHRCPLSQSPPLAWGSILRGGLMTSRLPPCRCLLCVGTSRKSIPKSHSQ